MKAKLMADPGYSSLITTLGQLITEARRSSARAVNTVMTATYWEVGRNIVEFEQGGERRAVYGQELLRRLAKDLTERFGRGFSERNLLQMRLFYLEWQIPQIDSAKSTPPIPQNSSAESSGLTVAQKRRPNFPLPWSHYVRLMSVKEPRARDRLTRRPPYRRHRRLARRVRVDRCQHRRRTVVVAAADNAAVSDEPARRARQAR